MYAKPVSPQKVTIYNTKGVIVKEFLQTLYYDVSDLSSGLYLAVIQEQGKKVTRHLFKKD